MVYFTPAVVDAATYKEKCEKLRCVFKQGLVRDMGQPRNRSCPNMRNKTEQWGSIDVEATHWEKAKLVVVNSPTEEGKKILVRKVKKRGTWKIGRVSGNTRALMVELVNHLNGVWTHGGVPPQHIIDTHLAQVYDSLYIKLGLTEADVPRPEMIE